MICPRPGLLPPGSPSGACEVVFADDHAAPGELVGHLAGLRVLVADDTPRELSSIRRGGRGGGRGGGGGGGGSGGCNHRIVAGTGCVDRVVNEVEHVGLGGVCHEHQSIAPVEEICIEVVRSIGKHFQDLVIG